MMYVLGALLTMAYVPGWTGASVITGWPLLSVLLPFAFLSRQVEMGLGHWLGLSFLAYAVLAMAWTPIWQQGVWDLWLTFILAGAFCLGGQRIDLSKLWVGMAIGLLLCEGTALAQMLDYPTVFNNNSPNAHTYAGTYVNPDMFGETACLLTIALITVRVRWPLLITIPPIYLTQSRSVYVAYAAVIAFALWDRYRMKALLPALFVLLVVGWVATSNSASRPYFADSIQERLDIWRDTIDGITLKGRGPGSFYMLYPQFASRTDTMRSRPEDPHNEFLNLAFEYGVGALPFIALLGLGFLAGGPERYILVAFLVIAFISFPTRIPTEGFVGLVALGRLCSRRRIDGLVDELRRSPTVAWVLRGGSPALAIQSLHPHKGRL